MASFQWDSNFETELATVDQQHFHLVQLINQFGELVTSDQLVKKDVDQVYEELVAYTQYHFEEEELMMVGEGLSPRHLEEHVNSHRNFLNQLKEIHLSLESSNRAPKGARRLLDFLVHWLAYHILITDQNMARQVKAIQAGASAEQAYEEQEIKTDGATKPLLNALNGLLEQVTARNQELLELNLSLERKVAERTQELSVLNSHLQELSLTDSLTHLPNRRHGMRFLTDAWEESMAAHANLSCMMIDADYFKQVNDTHGHDAGDKVLCCLSQLFQETIRSDDLVCRLGGDEFLIICPNTDIQGALQLAKQIHKKVQALAISVGDGEWPGSISVGVAEKTVNMSNCESLIQAADRQVYAAKDAGKNCVKAVMADS